MVLEKTLENPLDSKEIKPVNPKENQPWTFIGKTNAEAEAPILGHLMWRANSLGKTLMLGKIESRRRRGWQRMRWLEGVTDSVNMNKLFMSDSSWPHGQQHARPPCPSPTPRVTQIHVHWVGDAIQPSHPLSYPSPPAFNFFQHRDLFQWVSSLHQVAKVLECQLQHQSFQWTLRTDLLEDGLVSA